MNITDAVKSMGPGLALTVFDKADLEGKVGFAEWRALFRVVASPEALIAHGYGEEVRSQPTIAHEVGLRLGLAAKTFEQRCAAIDALIESAATGDESMPMILVKAQLIGRLVEEATTMETVERVNRLLDRASTVWPTTLASGSTLPEFRNTLRRNAVAAAKGFADWHGIATRIKGRYPEWIEVMEKMLATAGESPDNWALIHKEALRMGHERSIDLSLDKLVELVRG